MANETVKKKSKFLPTGVGIHKHPNHPDYPFYSRICVNGKQKWLGYYKCEVLAAEAYNEYIDQMKLNKKHTEVPDCGDCDECTWNSMDIIQD